MDFTIEKNSKPIAAELVIPFEGHKIILTTKVGELATLVILNPEGKPVDTFSYVPDECILNVLTDAQEHIFDYTATIEDLHEELWSSDDKYGEDIRIKSLIGMKKDPASPYYMKPSLGTWSDINDDGIVDGYVNIYINHRWHTSYTVERINAMATPVEGMPDYYAIKGARGQTIHLKVR